MTSDVQDIDARLIKDLAANTRRRDKALRHLIDRYAGRFTAYYKRQGYQEFDIDDMLQEVFLSVLKNAQSYRGDGAASAWLWQIARNAAHSRYRSERKHDADEFDEALYRSPLGEQYTEVDRQDLEDCVKERFAAFAEANPDRAQVIAMAAFHGWKPADIARVIGRTAAATREYLSQARKALRRCLVDCFSQGSFA